MDPEPTLTAAGHGSPTALTLTAMGRLPKVLPAINRETEMPMLPLVLSSDSHVFEPPDLWQTRIDKAFRDRAPRIERIDGGDHVVVEADQILSGIGLISNAGALRGPRDHLRPRALRRRAPRRVRPRATPRGHGARWGGR